MKESIFLLLWIDIKKKRKKKKRSTLKKKHKINRFLYSTLGSTYVVYLNNNFLFMTPFLNISIMPEFLAILRIVKTPKHYLQ